eukprot:746615-Hanusia_phi.AAC.4
MERKGGETRRETREERRGEGEERGAQGKRRGGCRWEQRNNRSARREIQRTQSMTEHDSTTEPLGNSWTLLTASAGWSPRGVLASATLSNKFAMNESMIVMVGGVEKGGNLSDNQTVLQDDVWISEDGRLWVQATQVRGENGGGGGGGGGSVSSAFVHRGLPGGSGPDLHSTHTVPLPLLSPSLHYPLAQL